jgi:hypothetical protein
VPTQPRTPATASRQIGANGKASFPIPSSVATLPAAFGQIGQLVSYFQTTTALGIPSIAANTITVLTLNVPLTVFPQPITVPTGWTAFIISSVAFFNAHAISGIILGTPGVAFLNNGYPQSTLLQPGSYAAPALQLELPVLAPAGGYAGGTASLHIWALLLASPN